MINVQMLGEDAHTRFKELLIKAGEATLSQQNADTSVEMGIMLGDDKLLEKLNFEHANEMHATDVLSFQGGDINPESGNVYLGDIAISVSRAKAQAKAGQHSLEDELQLLVVHGVLHLLGHDHAKQDEKDRMWKAQKELLSILGISLDIESLGVH